MRILPGALACVNCDTPVAQPAAPQGNAPVTGYPPPPPGYAPPPAGWAPPPGYPPPPAGWAPPPTYAPPPGSPPSPYYPATQYGPAPGPTNGLTIASLVLSLLWLGGLGSLLGIIFGHVSHGQIKRRQQRGSGIALAGLIVGYIGLVASIVFWSLLPRIIDSGTVQDVLVQQDVRSAASAEHDFFNDTGAYTNDGHELRVKGFNPLGHNMILAATSTDGFCVVGAHDGTDKWYVDDSNDGFTDFVYSTADEAEQACTVTDLGNFATIN